MADDEAFGRTLDPAYRIVSFRDGTTPSEAVVDLWAREGVLSRDAGKQRVAEVVTVAVEANSGDLVGVSTAPRKYAPKLGVDMWYVRAFVCERARTANIAAYLIDRTRSELEDRFASGADRSAAGCYLEVQNEGVKRTQHAAVWPTTRYVFVGVNQRGDHIRVRYFPGAVVPNVLPAGP